MLRYLGCLSHELGSRLCCQQLPAPLIPPRAWAATPQVPATLGFTRCEKCGDTPGDSECWVLLLPTPSPKAGPTAQP